MRLRYQLRPQSRLDRTFLGFPCFITPRSVKPTVSPTQNSFLSAHWATTPGYAVTVTPVVEYSRAFRNKVNAAENEVNRAKTRNAFDYFGFGIYDD